MKMFSRVSCSTTRVKVRRRARTFGRGSFRGVFFLIPAMIAWSFSMAASTIGCSRQPPSPAAPSCARKARSCPCRRRPRPRLREIGRAPRRARTLRRAGPRRAQGQGGGRAARRARAEPAPRGARPRRGHGARGSAQWSHGVWSPMVGAQPVLALDDLARTAESLETFGASRAFGGPNRRTTTPTTTT